MASLNQVEIAVVVEIAQVDIRPCLVLRRIVIESAEIGNKAGSADVLETAVFETRAAGLEYKQTAVREAAHGVLDIVAADGDIEPAVLVRVADAGLAIVGHFVSNAHSLRDIAKNVPGALADVQPIA
ncbi:MAG: hypothetical protein BWZ10_01761 [candidate division BRC1 bacterium ADurb.BinA364]|nr:MAG: hypothetical protein BWZ10_01761 [candidate division BRC1 bacterium ADurb.BinA364]